MRFVKVKYEAQVIGNEINANLGLQLTLCNFALDRRHCLQVGRDKSNEILKQRKTNLLVFPDASSNCHGNIA